MQSNLLTLLENALPVAHNVFLERQTPPYLIYRDGDFERLTTKTEPLTKIKVCI